MSRESVSPASGVVGLLCELVGAVVAVAFNLNMYRSVHTKCVNDTFCVLYLFSLFHCSIYLFSFLLIISSFPLCLSPSLSSSSVSFACARRGLCCHSMLNVTYLWYSIGIFRHCCCYSSSSSTSSFVNFISLAWFNVKYI